MLTHTTKQDTANLTAFLADGHMQAGEGGSWVVHCDDMIAPVHLSSKVPVRTPRLDLVGGSGDESSAALCRKSRIPGASGWWCLFVRACSVGCFLLPLLCFSGVYTTAPCSLSAAPAGGSRTGAKQGCLFASRRASASASSHRLALPPHPATRDNPSTTARSRVQTSVAEPTRHQ